MNIRKLFSAPYRKWQRLSKWKKVGVAAAGCGLAVVASPFAVAAAMGCSVISALAVLGGGTVASGGFGVAGGIVTVAGGSALSATLGGAAASKFADDPELTALKDNYAAIENRVKILVATVKKLKKTSDGRSAGVRGAEKGCEQARKRFDRLRARMKKFVAKKKHRPDEVRRLLAEIENIGEDLDEISAGLPAKGAGRV